MSQPNPPAQLNQQEQDALVKQVGIALIRSAPSEWKHIDADFRAVGRHFELSSRALDASGRELPWTPGQDAAMVFARLRAGMHGETGGTWFNAHYTIDHPSSYNLEFDRREPQWNSPPPPQAYRDELQLFPRREEHVPDWLARQLPASNQERPERRFRIARIFDRPGPDGRPTVDRPDVEPDERERLLTYLERSALILPMRGRDLDRLASDGRQSVPVAFHSDGTWIWPAAVGYYLRTHGVPPEPGLVEHAREHGFAPAEIDENTASAAAANITGPRPSPQQAAEDVADEPASAAPPAPAALAEPEPEADDDVRLGPPQPVAEPVVPPLPAPVPPAPEPAVPEHAVPEPAMVAPEHTGNGDHAEPAAPPGAQQAPSPAADAVLTHLRGTLGGVGIPESAYRIGEPPEPHTWYLEQVDDGWQVGWYEREFATPMLFDEVADAAAFLLGKLLLDHTDGTEDTAESRSHAEAAPLPPPVPEPAIQEPQPARHSEPEPVAEQEEAPAQEWDIRPLPGEPPLTLFHNKRVVELQAGAEIDRHGTTEGNLGYEIGTPFPERSLPPDWQNREYHVYRLQQPVVALAGEAIPWFEQPGGGVAYLLPHSVQELLDSGDIAEVVLEEPAR